MALNEANIKAVITAEDKASAVLGGFGKNVDGIAGKIASTLKVVAEGAIVATAAVTGFATLSLKAYSEHEEVFAQVNQVLQTTGKNATITSKQVEDLSFSMERYSGKSHDAIAQGQTLLLQFSQVTSKNLPEFSKAMVDLSQRMGVDTVTAAKQLGIALDSPTTGMARLRRSGIDFTESQKEAIKALEKSGDLAGADALLMKALEEKVGGAAGAYRNTLGGSVAAARQSLKDFEETVGGTIAKYLEPLAKSAADALSKIDWQKVVDNTIRVLKEWQHELDNTWQRLDKIYQAVEHYLEPKLEALRNTMEKNLIPSLIRLWKEVLEPLIKVLGPIAGEGLVWAMGLVIDYWNIMAKVVSGVTNFLLDHKTAVIAVATAFGVLVTAMAIGAAISAVQVGFATLTLITIPGLITELGALGAAFLAAMPVIAVAIAAAAIVASIYTIKGAWDAVNAAARAANNLDNAATEDQIRNFQKQAAAARAVGDTKKAGQIANAIAALTGGRAEGGPILAGGAYLVGEKGPEIVVPNQNATVIPNNKIGGSVNITIQVGALMGNDVEARKFAQLIMKHFNDAQGMVMA